MRLTVTPRLRAAENKSGAWCGEKTARRAGFEKDARPPFREDILDFEESIHEEQGDRRSSATSVGFDASPGTRRRRRLLPGSFQSGAVDRCWRRGPVLP